MFQNTCFRMFKLNVFLMVFLYIRVFNLRGPYWGFFTGSCLLCKQGTVPVRDPGPPPVRA